jgi:hypothetical protein
MAELIAILVAVPSVGIAIIWLVVVLVKLAERSQKR